MIVCCVDLMEQLVSFLAPEEFREESVLNQS